MKKAEKMIDLGAPWCGWEELTIGRKCFPVSYLSDLWQELDDLFDLEDDVDNLAVKRIMLEGESYGDLHLTAMRRKYGEELMIIWDDEEDYVVMTFPYKEFMLEYIKEKNNIGENVYVRDFLMEERI